MGIRRPGAGAARLYAIAAPRLVRLFVNRTRVCLGHLPAWGICRPGAGAARLYAIAAPRLVGSYFTNDLGIVVGLRRGVLLGLLLLVIRLFLPLFARLIPFGLLVSRPGTQQVGQCLHRLGIHRNA